MKRGTLQHPKTRRLARLLGIHPTYALGLLDALLDWAYDNAIRGDIGRWEDDEIAHGAQCEIVEPSAFVTALVQSGWVDVHPTHRLVIHQLSEHADDTWKKRLGRKRLHFADLDTVREVSGQCPDIVRQSDAASSDNVRDVRSGQVRSGQVRSGQASGAADAPPRAPLVTAEDVGATRGVALLPFQCPADLQPTEGMRAALRDVGCRDPEAEIALYATHYASTDRREIDWTETGRVFPAWVARHGQMRCAGAARASPAGGAAGRQAESVDALKRWAQRREATTA